MAEPGFLPIQLCPVLVPDGGGLPEAVYIRIGRVLDPPALRLKRLRKNRPAVNGPIEWGIFGLGLNVQVQRPAEVFYTKKSDPVPAPPSN